MKKHNLNRNISWSKVASFVLVAVIIGSMVNGFETHAGASKNIIDSSSFAESLDRGAWNDPNSDITIKDGKILFTAKHREDTRLITSRAIVKSPQHSTLFQAKYTMKINDIPKGKVFATSYSLSTIDASLGNEDSLAIIYKKKDGKVVASVVTYDADGKAHQVKGSKTCNVSMGSQTSVNVEATTDGDLKIVVNYTTLYSGKAPIDMTGRIGFMQDGACKVEISKIDIISYTYDTPENTNINEDFEKGTFNVNTMSSFQNGYSFMPSSLSVTEYKGNQVLMFKNVGMGWFGTKYQYSNFECSFDIPYMKHVDELMNGQIVGGATDGFVLTYGDSSDFYDTFGYDTSADGFVFQRRLVYRIKDSSNLVTLNDKNLFDPSKNEGFSIKLRVVDTKVTMHVKPLDSDNWQEIFSYTVGDKTPMGYIHIWSSGNASIAIDNFKVKNLDEGKKLIDVEYKEYYLEGTADWVYEEPEVKYLEVTDTDENKSMFEGPMLLVLAGGVAVVILAVCAIVALIIRTPKRSKAKQEITREKGDVTDEM